MQTVTVSRNKGGRPPGARVRVLMLQGEAERLGKMALEQLEIVASQALDGDPRTAAVKVAACKEILDRAGLTADMAAAISRAKLEAERVVDAEPQSEPTPELESGLGPSDPLN